MRGVNCCGRSGGFPLVQRAMLAVALAVPTLVAAREAPAAAGPQSGAASLAALEAALPRANPPALEEDDAVWLASLSLGCTDQLQPPPSPVAGPQRRGTAPLTGASPPVKRGDTHEQAVTYFWNVSYQVVPDYEHTRAFWGCKDWHSAVSSAWVLSQVVGKFHLPAPMADLTRDALATHLGAPNIRGELAYFEEIAKAPPPPDFGPPSGMPNSFERPYGYAWLLKLYSSMLASPDGDNRKLAKNLEPLASWMRDNLKGSLKDLTNPSRGGSQTNTAFTLALLLDSARDSHDPELTTLIGTLGQKFYGQDKPCDFSKEELKSGPVATRARLASKRRPKVTGDHDLTEAARTGPALIEDNEAASASSTLSPCLSEAALMARLMDPPHFQAWLTNFLPPLESPAFAPIAVVGDVQPSAADRDRFAAVSLQRGYALRTIAKHLPPNDPRATVLLRLSALHGARGLKLMRGDVEGSTWLPALALLYLEN